MNMSNWNLIKEIKEIADYLWCNDDELVSEMEILFKDIFDEIWNDDIYTLEQIKMFEKIKERFLP